MDGRKRWGVIERKTDNRGGKWWFKEEVNEREREKISQGEKTQSKKLKLTREELGKAIEESENEYKKVSMWSSIAGRD